MYQICIKGWDKSHLFVLGFIAFFGLWSLLSIIRILYGRLFWTKYPGEIVERRKRRSARFISTNFDYFVRYRVSDHDVVGVNPWSFPRDRFQVGQQVDVFVSPKSETSLFIYDGPKTLYVFIRMFVFCSLAFLVLMLGRACGS